MPNAHAANELPEHADDTPVVLAFLERVLEDRQRGGVRPSEVYEAQFPGHEPVIAREYAKLDATASPTETPLHVGRYLVRAQLGRGGQGTVYLAEDPRLGRPVALKVLTELGGADRQTLLRFRLEAEMASRLNHPGISTVYDCGDIDGCPFIAMQLIEGRTLADLLRDDEALRLDAMLELFEKIARALHHAHEHGIVHRDIKPANVMVDAAGEPVILDFGIARDLDPDLLGLTRTGDVVGTPAYTAPELLRSERVAPDRRLDVWALGVSLFEAVTGRRPFEEPTRERLYRSILEQSVPDPRSFRPDLSDDLAAVLQTALADQPVARYQTAAALAEDLRRIRAREPVLAKPITRWTRVRHWTRNNRALSIASTVAVTALLGGLVATEWQRQRAVDAAALADRRSVEARYQSYVGNLIAATLAGESDNTAEAFRRLAACPPEHRGWEWYHLSLAYDSSSSRLEFSGANARAVAFSPDGRQLAAGSVWGELRIWDAGGALLSRLDQGVPIGRIAWSGDGLRLVTTASIDQREEPWDELVMWDVKSGRAVFRIPSSRLSASSVAFHPSAPRIFTGSRTGGIREWNATNGEQVSMLADGLAVEDIAVTSDGRRLVASASAPTTSLHVFDVDRRELVQTIATAGAGRICIAPDDDLVAMTVLQRTAELWSLRTGAQLATLPGQVDLVWNVAFTPDGERLFTCGRKKALERWQVADQRTTGLLLGHRDQAYDVAIDPSGTRLASSSEDEVRLWDVVAGPPVLAWPASRRASGAAWSRDGRSLLLADRGSCSVWDAHIGTTRTTLATGSEHGCVVAACDSWHATGMAGEVRLWDPASGDLIRTLSTTTEPKSVIFAVGMRGGDEVWAIDQTGHIHTWDTANAAPGRAIAPCPTSVVSVGCDEGFGHLAAAGPDGSIHVLDIATGTWSLCAKEDHAFFGIAVAPGARWVAAVMDDMKQVAVWDPARGRRVATLHGGERGTVFLDFSPNGKRLVGSSYGELVIWAGDSWDRLASLPTQSKFPGPVVFDPSGTRLLHAGRSGVEIFESERPAAERSWRAMERLRRGR